jgi:hypothetical protein
MFEHAVIDSAGRIRSTIASASRHARFRDVRISTSDPIAANNDAASCHDAGSRACLPGSDVGPPTGPAVAPELVLIVAITVAVCVPSSVTVGVANEHVAAAGNGEHPNVTVCVEPFSGAMLTATVPDAPLFTVSAVGAMLTLKSPVLAAFTTCDTAEDVEAA